MKGIEIIKGVNGRMECSSSTLM